MPRSVCTIHDLSDNEINGIFALADDVLARQSTDGQPWRVRGVNAIADQLILATVFCEPSTRTRLSFESAMHRLGGHVISSASSEISSASKGESLADTVRVIENYADLIVLRHPWEGAARVAQEKTSVPIINAGDGSHEHPSQTLCDLYTLRRENDAVKERGSFEGINVLLRGDLKHGRTVHSLVYALARFGANIICSCRPGFELPPHVIDRMQREFGRAPTLLDESDDAPGDIDAVYVTRLQVERLEDGTRTTHYPALDSKQLEHVRYRRTSVMHPLPRVEELSYEIDSDPRGIYFKQSSYGVAVRMALITAIFKLSPIFSLSDKASESNREISSDRSLVCANAACVTNQATERRYLTPKFEVLSDDRVQCRYCEHELMRDSQPTSSIPAATS